MIKFQIRRKTTKVWQHFITDGENFIFSKCYCKTNGDKFRVVEDGGTAKNEYNYDEIEVYDDLNSGSAETFTSSLELMERLSVLGYVGFSKDGDVVIADLISTDPSNAVELGTDNKLFVPVVSGGVKSVTGSMVNNTDPLNPIIEPDDDKLDKSTTPNSIYATDSSGNQEMISKDSLKEVLEFANLAAFPVTGETGKIYVAKDTNFTYRWSGSTYVQIGGGDNKQIFYTPGTKYSLDTISSCYSTNVETGFASALINSPAGNMPTAMGVRWVLPLFMSEKNQKLKEVNIRITNATFPTFRLVIFTGLSVNNSSLRINNQIIHDQNYTLNGGNLFLQKITSFTNDVTIPIGYDLCFFLIRVDGTTGTLSNFQISGYAS